MTRTRNRAALIAAAFILASAAPARAESAPTPYTLELGASTGFLYGVSKELVYAAPGSDTLLSELDWAMEPLFYWGLRIDLRPARALTTGFVARLSLRSGFAGYAGTMTDTDWLNGGGEKTHFSAHDSYVEQALLADLLVGWTFPLRRALELRPYAGVGYMHFRWTARDGYAQYTAKDPVSGLYDEWSSSLPKTSIYGTGIGYEQIWFLPYLGAELAWHASDRWSLAGSLSVAPWAVCADQDDHYLRSLQFNETSSGGFAVEPRLEAALKLTDRTTLSFAGSYRFISGLRGDVTISDIGTNSATYEEEDTAGVEYSVFDFGATLSVKL
jgi:outer membrane protease